VDDTLWLDMANDGFKPGTRDIYFFKLDSDPAVYNALPGAKADKWKDIQYVISTPYMWENATKYGMPIAYELLNHSKVLWQYGTGDIRTTIQIRKVIP